MEVGDYVRTKDYGIHKISNLEHYDYIDYIVCENQFNIIKIDKSNIIKSAEGTPKGLLSLIEVGDYVNGHKVIKICNDYVIATTDEEYDSFIKIKKENIKSIVTKEQFSSMEYKVGE